MSTKIAWCEETWNPIVGCSKISAGCQNCYAEKAAGSPRLQQFVKYRAVTNTVGKGWKGIVYFDKKSLDKPLHWKQPRRIFVSSMGDFFHPTADYIDQTKVMAMIERCKQHTFLFLTKRPKGMAQYFRDMEVDPPKNCWLGVTAENQEWWDKRKEAFFSTPAAKHFVSNEPLIGNIKYTHDDLRRLDWVIVGAESGAKRRYCKLAWLSDLVGQCVYSKTPVFVKQIHKDGKLIKMPKLFPQEYPDKEK